MLGSWKEQTELRTGKGLLPSRKRRKPTEKAYFWLVKKFCGLVSNCRIISQSFRGTTAWQKEGSWIVLFHFRLFVSSVR